MASIELLLCLTALIKRLESEAHIYWVPKEQMWHMARELMTSTGRDSKVPEPLRCKKRWEEVVYSFPGLKGIHLLLPDRFSQTVTLQGPEQ